MKIYQSIILLTLLSIFAYSMDRNKGMQYGNKSSSVLLMHFNEGSGLTANDNSGIGNNGTISGAAWVERELLGNCLDFAGVADKVTIPNDASWGTSILTIGAWVKRDTIGVRAHIFDCVNTPVGGFQLYIFGDRIRFVFKSASAAWPGPNAISDDTYTDTTYWHFIVATTDEVRLKLYYDGELIKNIPSAVMGISNIDLYVGCNSGSTGSVNGKMDESFMLNKALTAEEIRYMYNLNPRSMR